MHRFLKVFSYTEQLDSACVEGQDRDDTNDGSFNQLFRIQFSCIKLTLILFTLSLMCAFIDLCIEFLSTGW